MAGDNGSIVAQAGIRVRLAVAHTSKVTFR